MILSKNVIKIPSGVGIVYCKNKNLLTFFKNNKTKSLRPQFKIIFVTNFYNAIQVTGCFKLKAPKTDIKNRSALKGALISKIRHFLIEITQTLYQKLRFVGVGYRVLPVSEDLQNVMQLKLGRSHLVFFSLPEALNHKSFKMTKLFVFGNVNYPFLRQAAASLRQQKPPEVYKGKGILYDREKICRKVGKKV